MHKLQRKMSVNYRGCIIYQQLLDKLCVKYNSNSTPIINPQFTQPGTSYAQKAQDFIPTTKKPEYATVCRTQYENDMAILKNMMKDLISQMSTMLNLLTILVSKTSN